MQKDIKKIVSSKLDYLLLILAIAGSMAMMFLVKQSREVTALQGVSLEMIGRLAQPLASLRRLGNAIEENRRLRYQNAMLQIRNSQLAEAHYENLRLRELLKFGQSTTAELIPARLIGSGDNLNMATILLDAGYQRGIRENMPVVSADGLVGRVVSVSRDYCTVQLLSDLNFRVAALDQRSRVQGVFQWIGLNNGVLNGVYLSADVKIGDWIVTSGQNSFFPTGLKIGVVSRIDDVHAGWFQKIYIKSRLDFSRLEEVFIMTRAAANQSGE